MRNQQFKVSCQLFPWRGDYEKAVEAVSKLGFKTCEMGSKVLLKYEYRLSELVNLLETNKISVSGVFEFGHYGNWEKRREIYLHHDRIAFLLNKLGIRSIILSPGASFKKKRLDYSEKKQVVQMLAEISKRYRRFGIKIGIHPHIGTFIFTRTDIDLIMESVQEVYLVPDLGHMTQAKINVFRLLSDYLPNIMCVHFKDMKYKQHRYGNIRRLTFPQVCELGEGDINISKVIQFLKDKHYNGWLTIEIDKQLLSPEKSIAICKNYLEKNDVEC